MDKNRDHKFVKSGSLGAALAVGGVGHLLANLGFKGMRAAGKFARTAKATSKVLKPHQKAIAGAGTKFNVGQSKGIASSIGEGIKGAPTSLGQRMGETWVAPEFWGGKHIGKSLGESLRPMSTGRRYKTLKKLRKRLAQNPGFTSEAPWAAHLQSGVDKALRTGLPKKGPIRKPSIMSNIAVAAPALPMAVVKPGGIAHMLVNRGRIAAAHSSLGKAVQEKQLYSGLGRATSVPKHLSRKARVKNQLTDYLVSPAVRDASKWSENLTRLAQKDPKRAKQLAGSLEGAFTKGPGMLAQVGKRARDAERATVAGNARGRLPWPLSKAEGMIKKKSQEVAKSLDIKNRLRLEELSKMYRNYPKSGRAVEPSVVSEGVSRGLKELPIHSPPLPATRAAKLKKRVRELLAKKSKKSKTYGYAPRPMGSPRSPYPMVASSPW